MMWPDRFLKREYLAAGQLARRFNITNPRQHPETQMDATEESLDQVGWIDEPSLSTNGDGLPSLADNPDAVMWDGHARVELTLAKFGPEAEVPVRWYRLTPEETDFALLVKDQITPMAEYDRGKLDGLMERARAMTVDRPGLQAMMEKVREAAGANGIEEEPPPEPPEVTQTEAEKYQEVWQVKPGDVWKLGRHIVGCVDSTDEGTVSGLVGDTVVTFVWQDPLYGIDIVAANGYVGGGEAYDIPFGGVKKNPRRRGYVGGGARIKDQTGRYPIQDWAEAKGLGSVGGAKPFGSKKVRGSVGASNLIAAGKYAPVIGDETTETAKKSAKLLLGLYSDAVQVWWGGNYYTDILPPSPGWIVWDKDNTGNFADCELAWTNQDRAARIFEHRWNGMLKASEQGQRRVHPTQKPIALAYECFQEYGKSNDIIFDGFLGSGISILATEQLNDGRRVIGCELAPEYVATVLHRFQQLTGIQPQRLTND
jgi:hypothetical protein